MHIERYRIHLLLPPRTDRNFIYPVYP
ncbi:Protein of unknown function [Pyronema omphalodes CBS 100304]|uniref:Uncharacterized protein n=1 Tax=Pyronema omphalodes (strain CBS 100304) TaxID=1076935 RepID=U4LNA4_PYROM|nr:Protein of unknown function [Pyronema omphalodes CBS 100304]